MCLVGLCMGVWVNFPSLPYPSISPSLSSSLPPSISPPLSSSLQEFLAQLAPVLNSSSAGIFADSCLIHCQTLNDEPWSTYAVGGQTMRETFQDWYFERSSAKYQEVDCPYPCNPTCPEPKINNLNNPF